MDSRSHARPGFYPVPARPSAVARAGRTRISLRLPRGLALVLDGQPIVNDTGGPFVVEGADVRTPTVVTDAVRSMCERLLANPVIEDFEIESAVER